MAAKSEAARAGSAIADVGGHVGRTLEAAVTKPPGWQELAWDAALVRSDFGRGGEPAGRHRERGSFTQRDKATRSLTWADLLPERPQADDTDN